jgi:hypothetical protein
MLLFLFQFKANVQEHIQANAYFTIAQRRHSVLPFPHLLNHVLMDILPSEAPSLTTDLPGI